MFARNLYRIVMSYFVFQNFRFHYTIFNTVNNLEMVLVCKSYPILIVTDIHIIKVWPETGYINYGRDYNLRLKFILIFYTWNSYGMLHPLLYKSCVFLRLMSSIIKLWSMRANQKQSITWCPLLFNWYIVVVWQIYLQV